MGSAPSSVALAPFDDPSFEIWSCSPAARPHLKRTDCHFEIHNWDDKFSDWNSPDYQNWMAGLACRVYTLAKVPSIPASIPYPKDEVMRYFGERAIFFYTSSLAWMFALAIIEIERSGKPGEICLYGVDMSANEEVYSGQRAGCQYWAGEARSRGIKVWVPGQSDLFRPAPLYGFCEHDGMYQKLLARKAELEARLNMVNINLTNLTSERTYLMGALEDVNYVKMTFVSDPLAMEMLKAFGQEPQVPALGRPLPPIVSQEAFDEAGQAVIAAGGVIAMAEAKDPPKHGATLWASTPVPNFVNGLDGGLDGEGARV